MEIKTYNEELLNEINNLKNIIKNRKVNNKDIEI